MNTEQTNDLAGANAQSLNAILQNTIDTIEGSKEQIFEVYERTKEEVDESRKNLEELKKQVRKTVDHVDAMIKKEQSSRQELVKVSSNFASYSESNIKKCYDNVKNVQVELGVAREKEFQLRRQRDKMEMRLINLEKTLAAAERIAMRIGAVLGYLSSQISDVVSQMEMVTKNKFLSAQIIRAQEEERFRVSREIHDGPAQDMANLLYQASICERLVDVSPDEAKEGLQELRRQIRGCLTDVRQIIFDMRPMSLDDLGLVPALRQLILKMRERGILDASLKVEGNEQPVAKHAEVGLFRIVQESLNNVNHHAGTKKAKVQLLFTDTTLAVLVSDEGEGFDMDSLQETQQDSEGEGHFGILGMRERARILGADLDISSVKGKGTRVHFKMKLDLALAEAAQAKDEAE